MIKTPMLDRVTIEENANRTKITIPLRRSWPLWGVYTILLLTWLGGTGWAVMTLTDMFRTGRYGFEGMLLLLWIAILITIAGFWIWMGRIVWRRWQYYTATREILFFYPDKLIVRRPLSLLGVTDAYDRNYIAPFRFDDKVNTIAFDYGSYRIPIANSPTADEADALIQVINDRFFADYQPEEETEL